MKIFKLKELVAVLCVITLSACVDLEDEINEENSGDPLAGEPGVSDPVVTTPDPGTPIVSIPDPGTPVVTTPDPGASVTNPFGDSKFVFQIIDDNDGFVTELQNGDVIDLSGLPELFHIEAVASDTFNSVSVQAYGPNYTIDRIEESPIWTVNDARSGFDASEGTFDIFARGYSLDGASGDASRMTSISITFAEGGGSVDQPVNGNPISPVEGGPVPTREVSLQWERPVLYTTGETLTEDDIAGYEILYRAVGEGVYKRAYIEGSNSLDADITLSGNGQFEFSIASVDTSGLYSEFTEPLMITL